MHIVHNVLTGLEQKCWMISAGHIADIYCVIHIATFVHDTGVLAT